MYRALTTVLGIGALAALIVSMSTAGSNVTRQRIAIEVRFDPIMRTGTWQVMPITPGPTPRDSGKLTVSGNVAGNRTRNGGTVTVIVGQQTLTGKHGNITVSQHVESADVQAGTGYSADVGTWTLTAGTGAFAGFKGGGRFAAVGLPSGIVLARQEGWVIR